MIKKILNFKSALYIKLCPALNRMVLRKYGAELGWNVQIPGKVHWQLGGVTN